VEPLTHGRDGGHRFVANGGNVAGTNDNIARDDGGEPALGVAPYRTQPNFLAAIRRGEVGAVRQLFIFYAPLLRDQARKMSVPDEDRDELVVTLLDDVVMHLQESALPPRELGSYLVAALRNRARNLHRDRRRRDGRSEDAYTEHGTGRERIVAECHSEYGLRQVSAEAEGDHAPLRSAIGKLAIRSALALDQAERELMVGVGRCVPLRDLAAQAGISYGAARVRVHRLRERMLKLAIQHLATLDDVERRELERFFRRAGVSLVAEERTRRRAPHGVIDDDLTGQDTDDRA
jgi:RNA polymerase sigma factor (sigma-70 family)